MMTAAVVAMILLLFLMAIGVPIAVALGVAGITVLAAFDLGYQMAGVNFVSSIASFPLLAIPFFVLAGVVFERARLAARIARLLELVVGRWTGGLAVVAVVTCVFWGAVSGSGPATTAAVGLVLLAPMVRHGYGRDFAAATIANASDLSIIIPPSIAFIIYGNLTGVSVSALFVAGIVPGLLAGAGIALTAWGISFRRGYRGVEQAGSSGELLRAACESVWALLAPVVILGGIYAGVFTPTEAAVVAVFYSLFVAMVIYRSVTIRDLPAIFADAAVTSSVIMMIVAFAGIFSWAISTTGVVDRLTAFVLRISPSTMVLVLLVDMALLVLGMFLDAISIAYIVLPVLLPMLAALRIDPVWYGVVFVKALAVGQTTPPVGVNLVTAANLVGSEMDLIAREIWPYVFANIAALIVISLWPDLSLWLPRLMGLVAR